MFRDLKEYQEITKIYQDSVHISEEERIITQIIREENFTQEELDYVIENFDEIYDNQILTEEFFDEMEGEYLEEMAVVKKAAQTIGKKVVPAVKKGVKKVVDTAKNVQPEIPGIGSGKTAVNTAKTTVKNVKPMIKKSTEKVGNMSKKVLDKAVPAAGVAGAGVGLAQKVGQSGVGKFAKNVVKGGKDIAKSAISKLKSGVKKVVSNPVVRNVAKGLAVATPIGAAAVGLKKLADRGKKIEQDKKNAAIEKQVDDYVEKRKNPGGINKVDGKQFDSRGQKPIETETKPKKMHSIEKKNRARFGDEKVDALKAKNADFKLMRKGTMSKADFIKKYPKSITAQKAAGLRDHTEWDAYDMVLEYLYSTEQVTSLEEANYVMMEMEHQTIGEIVKEVTVALSE